MLTLTLTLLLTLGDPVVSKLLELDDVTLELDVVLGVTAGVTLDVMLWDTEVVTSELDVVLGVTAGVTLDVMLWDTSVDAETLELDEVVADTLVLRERSVVGDADGDTGDSVLDCVTDKDAARDRDMVAEGAREALMVLDSVRESLRLALTDLDVVRSVDPLAVTLLDTEVDPVSEAVKLGDTGDFVTDGVTDGEGMITVYDMKNTEPEPRLIMLAPI